MAARRSPGVVRDAIVKVMKGKGTMSTSEILAAVRRETGQEIPSSSVRSYLRITPARFEQVSRGNYRLKK